MKTRSGPVQDGTWGPGGPAAAPRAAKPIDDPPLPFPLKPGPRLREGEGRRGWIPVPSPRFRGDDGGNDTPDPSGKEGPGGPAAATGRQKAERQTRLEGPL